MAESQVYACKCLNVRVKLQPASERPPDVGDPNFFAAYVADEGIQTIHNELTLRNRTRAKPNEDSTQWSRYTSLTCLICQTLVYRVFQVISFFDSDAKEGPILPTEEWTEQETLKSSDGWIEIQKGCLTGDAITKEEASPSYSSLFSLVIPPDLPPSPTPSTSLLPPVPSAVPSPSSPSPSEAPSQPVTHLPPLAPLFPPPPFTPTHRAFLHLASRAEKQSNSLRASAEEYIAQVTKEKVEELTKAEADLRRQVEILWRRFQEGVAKVEEESGFVRPTLTAKRRESSVHGASETQGMPMSIRDFVPMQAPPTGARPMSPLGPAQSGLSMSLATTSFHHPRAQQPEQRQVQEPTVASTAPTSAAPIQAQTSRADTENDEAVSRSVLEPFRRNMDQSKDIATSFRYVTDLEAGMEEIAKERLKEAEKRAGKRSRSRSPGADDVEPTIAGVGKGNVVSPVVRRRKSRSASRTRKEGASGSAVVDGAGETSTSPSRKDGEIKRRKVTFDVKPAVVTITRELEAEKKEREEEKEKNVDEMIFDLEDEHGNAVNREAASSPTMARVANGPLSEPARAPVRPQTKRRRATLQGLPESLSSLRPASLPAPSNIRPRTDVNGHDGDAMDTSSRPYTNGGDNEPENRKPHEAHLAESNEDTLLGIQSWDPREAEILKLVAAHTPSHRGAWQKDSKAWQMFVRKQKGKARYPGRGAIMEEEDDGEYANGDAGDGFEYDGSDEEEADVDVRKSSDWTQCKSSSLAASLPIAIGPLSQNKKVVGLPSYQPKTSLSDRPGMLVPPLRARSNSSALRRASYAERDRQRAMDPGTLDFAAVEGDEDEQDESDEDGLLPVHGRGRQRALKILKARAEVPEAGMWRSLA